MRPSVCADLFGCHVSIVHKWVRRAQAGQSMEDQQRSGRPAYYDLDLKLKITAFFCQTSPPKGYIRWSVRDAASYLKAHPTVLNSFKISRSAIHRILAENPLKPYRCKYYLHITDPDFFPKMEAIIQLYLAPPDHLFCFDECTGLQALERLLPNLPAKDKKPACQEFEYIRHGTTTVFAFQRTKTGQVFTQNRDSHNTDALCEVFWDHLCLQPHDATLHYICDNYATHYNEQFCAFIADLCNVECPSLDTGAERRNWLQYTPKRIMIHFVPFHGSWLNQVEIWFGILKAKGLNGLSYESVAALNQRTEDFTNSWNQEFAHPFAWKYKGESLKGQAVRRLTSVLGLPDLKICLRSLKKQIRLMQNLVHDAWGDAERADWENLLAGLLSKQSILFAIFDEELESAQEQPRKIKLLEKAKQSLSDLITSIQSALAPKTTGTLPRAA